MKIKSSLFVLDLNETGVKIKTVGCPSSLPASWNLDVYTDCLTSA